MAGEFSKLSYRGQVYHLRKYAEVALKSYPLKVRSLQFINHGENATFKVESQDRKKFLFRVHRGGYHTDSAIQEELDWLSHLASIANFPVPRPVPSNQRQLVSRIAVPIFPEGRAFNLFEWIEGRFILKSVNVDQMRQLGAVMAFLHSKKAQRKVKHRNYWNSEGLLGDKPKFGSIHHLQGATKSQQKLISETSAEVFQKLKWFEKKFPERQGLIHADLHFRNFLFQKKSPGLIDFDDCGFGFFGYDLAIPILSLERLGRTQNLNPQKLQDSIYQSYATHGHFDSIDELMIPYFLKARQILMLGWMNSRSDNPKIKGRLKEVITQTIDSPIQLR